jgi:hypothetical protein
MIADHSSSADNYEMLLINQSIFGLGRGGNVCDDGLIILQVQI